MVNQKHGVYFRAKHYKQTVPNFFSHMGGVFHYKQQNLMGPPGDADGNWTFERCSGGLVSCLAGALGSTVCCLQRVDAKKTIGPKSDLCLVP